MLTEKGYIVRKALNGSLALLSCETTLKLRSLQIDLQKKSPSLQREIEQRQRIQEALESSEIKNLALLNALPDVILRISRNGILLDYRAGMTLPDTTGETWLQSPTPAMANFPDFNPSFISIKVVLPVVLLLARGPSLSLKFHQINPMNIRSNLYPAT